MPDGTAYLKDDAELTAALIRRKGNKLCVDGRLTPDGGKRRPAAPAGIPQSDRHRPGARRTGESIFRQLCAGRESSDSAWQTVAGPGQGKGQDYWMLEAPDGLCVKSAAWWR